MLDFLKEYVSIAVSLIFIVSSVFKVMTGVFEEDIDTRLSRLIKRFILEMFFMIIVILQFSTLSWKTNILPYKSLQFNIVLVLFILSAAVITILNASSIVRAKVKNINLLKMYNFIVNYKYFVDAVYFFSLLSLGWSFVLFTVQTFAEYNTLNISNGMDVFLYESDMKLYEIVSANRIVFLVIYILIYLCMRILFAYISKDLNFKLNKYYDIKLTTGEEIKNLEYKYRKSDHLVFIENNTQHKLLIRQDKIISIRVKYSKGFESLVNISDNKIS